jgi:hypothetical protein
LRAFSRRIKKQQNPKYLLLPGKAEVAVLEHHMKMLRALPLPLSFRLLEAAAAASPTRQPNSNFAFGLTAKLSLKA